MAQRTLLISFCILTVTIFFSSSGTTAERVIIGWIENIKIAGLDLQIKSKIDTGAKTSSLGITKFTVFKKSGTEWVRFFVQGPMPEQVMLERPISRWTRIRRPGLKIQRRPVVILPTCLGGYYKQTQFTLENREAMNYGVLIGRRFLEDKFLVTAGQTYLSKPECAGKPLPNTPEKRR